jgi:DNA-binding HxlR family transcriptional regulator
MKHSTNVGAKPVHPPLPEEIQVAYKVLSGKWRLIIIWHLCDGKPQRFGEIKKNIPGITQHMLTTTLRDLEQEGLIKREVFPEVPPRVEYSVTDYGQALRPVLTVLHDWGGQHMKIMKKAKEKQLAG